MSPKDLLSKKIHQKKALIGIIGIGYVGTALGKAISCTGYNTIGYNTSSPAVTRVNSLKLKNFSATTDISQISNCDIYCVCVPTPIDKGNKPNLNNLENAINALIPFIEKGKLIVIESSVAPGTTRNFTLPLLNKSGLKAGVDFFLSFSPERIDPGNKKFKFQDIPKVVSGYDQESLDLVSQFYQSFTNQIVPVSTIETAELTKVFENVFRLVNISLVNELIDYAKLHDINIWEMIDAASTKPYGFLPHYPGPGAGGDCIPVMGHYLLTSANENQLSLPVTQAATKVNKRQPEKVAIKAMGILNGNAKSNNQNKVLLLGVTYKPDVSDTRQTAADPIWKLLEKENVNVSYHDPLVSQFNGVSSSEFSNKILDQQDLIIIITDHSSIPFSLLEKIDTPVLDTRNVLPRKHSKHITHL